MADLLILIASFGILTVALYFGCTLYLAFSRRISLPLDVKGNAAIGIAWLVLASVSCVIGVAGVKLAGGLTPDINNAIGIVPVAIGLGLSLFLRRSEWREFYLRFQNR